MIARVSGLFIYPLKGARAVALTTATLAPYGLKDDRIWMLTDERGRFLSQRTHPYLACLRALVTESGLSLSYPGSAPIDIHAFVGGSECRVQVWDDALIAWDAGDHIANWLYDALRIRARLVRVSPRSERCADPSYVGDSLSAITFSDGYPVLVCSSSSLTELNRRLPEPVPMDRFRPNIVIEGLEPFFEDHISVLAINQIRLRLVKPCTRCQVPSIDQDTGVLATDPLPVLRRFRFDHRVRGVTFGVNGVLAGSLEGELKIGAPVSLECSDGRVP